LRLNFSKHKIENNSDPEQIINALTDWLDSKDNDATSGISGAESDYYQGLDPPYFCANAPLNHIDELLQIKGINKDLFWVQTDDQEDSSEAMLDLKNIFTVYGLDENKLPNNSYRYKGKININTASGNIIAAILPEGLDQLATDLVEYRERKSEQADIFLNPLDNDWYKKVIELTEKEMDQFDQSIGYSSHFFKIECTAKKNNNRMTIVAFVKREKNKITGNWDCRTLLVDRE